MRRRGIIFFAIGVVSLSGAGLALYFQKARAVAQSAPVGFSETVDRTQLLGRASSGDVKAQVKLAKRSLEATDRPPDYTEALKWLLKAAEANSADAQCLLGMLYQTGRGVQRDYTNAASWFEKAAAQSNAEALYNLGSLYAAGRGVEQDTHKAAQYYSGAAQLGDAYAQFNFGQRCELGLGVATNIVEAWKWYDLAGLGGVADSAKYKRSLEPRMTAVELQQARQAVDNFLKQNDTHKAL